MEYIFLDAVRIYDSEVILRKWVGIENNASPFNVKYCTSGGTHTTITNDLVETKGKLEVVAVEADKEVAVVEEAVSAEDFEEAAEVAEETVVVVAVLVVVLAADDEEIHMVKEVVVVNNKGIRKALYIVRLIFIEYQIKANIQGGYREGIFYHGNYLYGMKHTPQSITS